MSNKSKRVFSLMTMLVLLAIGFLSGATFEKQKRVKYDKNNAELGRKICLKDDTLSFWKDGYLRRDTALQKISGHKDCTFKIKSIIGDIN